MDLFSVGYTLTHTYTYTQECCISFTHFAHALGFSRSTSRLPATDLDAQTVSLTLQVLHI
jgi:hypothetical protein